jgi:hypothetical protein
MVRSCMYVTSPYVLLNTTFLGQCVPWRMRSLDDAYPDDVSLDDASLDDASLDNASPCKPSLTGEGG